MDDRRLNTDSASKQGLQVTTYKPIILRENDYSFHVEFEIRMSMRSPQKATAELSFSPVRLPSSFSLGRSSPNQNTGSRLMTPARNRLSVVASAEASALEELIAQKEDQYCAEMANLRKQMLSFSEQYAKRETELVHQHREASAARQALEAEVALLTDSQQRLIRENAELESRIEGVYGQLGELMERNEQLELKVAPVFSFEGPSAVLLAQEEVHQHTIQALSHALDAAKTEIANAHAESNSLATSLETALERLTLTEAERDAQGSELSVTRTELSDLRSELDAATRERDTGIARIAALEGSRASATQDLEMVRTDFAEQVTRLESLLDGEVDRVRTLTVNLEVANAGLTEAESLLATSKAENETISERLRQLRENGLKDASEKTAQFVDVQAAAAQARQELRVLGGRLKAALSEQARLEQQLEAAEKLLTEHQRKEYIKIPSEYKPDGSELRRLQMEAAELRMQLSELQNGDGSRRESAAAFIENIAPKTLSASPIDRLAPKRQRKSLDQEECRQQ